MSTCRSESVPKAKLQCSSDEEQDKLYCGVRAVDVILGIPTACRKNPMLPREPIAFEMGLPNRELIVEMQVNEAP
jgi:hypothetical protein